MLVYGGLGDAVLSAFLQAAARPLAPPPWLPRAACTLPLPGAGNVQRAARARSARARRLAFFEPAPPLGWLGRLPVHLQLRPGGDRRRLRRLLPRLPVELRETIGEPALRVAQGRRLLAAAFRRIS